MAVWELSLTSCAYSCSLVLLHSHLKLAAGATLVAHNMAQANWRPATRRAAAAYVRANVRRRSAHNFHVPNVLLT